MSNDIKGKTSLIMGIKPEDYDIFDMRIKKPITVEVDLEDSDEMGTMVLQDVDELLINGNKLSYFLPNNVAVLLSITKRAQLRAKENFDSKLNPLKNDISLSNAKDKIPFLKEKSKDVCDYIEEIQTSIVFSYTALEAFANLSIPVNYFYHQKVKNKGIDEQYDKKAIERWISLETKIKIILPEIYKTRKIDTTKNWAYFKQLEGYRHDIIHQKTIEDTEFYKRYFRNDIFKICDCAVGLIHFFYEKSELKSTNPLWPWIVGQEKEFPKIKDKGANYEVVGNVYEGFKRKK
jgi:hypothetical protein